MPPRNLGPTEQSLLKGVTDAHTAHMVAKRNLKEEIEAAYETQLSTLRYTESFAMNLAKRGGVPESHIQAASGIGNWYKFKEAMAIAANDVSDNDVKSNVNVKTGPGWSYDEQTGVLEVDTWLASEGMLAGIRHQGKIWYSDPLYSGIGLGAERFDIQGPVFNRWTDFKERLVDIYSEATGNTVQDLWDIPVQVNG